MEVYIKKIRLHISIINLFLGISQIGVAPYHHQAKKSKHLKRRKLESLSGNVLFFRFGGNPFF
ncbi:hypothetical protein CN491_24025 [Bacillus cereus]|uniref:Uncharacterized protein n=1 Tax=Bacillus cereus TaxID=1396 RepID=A0A2A8LHT5_BACCE|nr:hypothetical protein CN491_24025 [Bacillus cereus]PGT13530.1 hypothetical protein COC96_23245 [Bacillus cereus]